MSGNNSGSPLICVDWDGEQAKVRGVSHCELGTRIGSANDESQGVYAAWRWQDNTLTANTDRYGFYSLFYYVRDGVIMVSPSLLQLIAEGADSTLDQRALGVFHRLGLFIDNDTPFKHIRVLPPGGSLSWRRGKLEAKGDIATPRQRQISRADALDGMNDLFETSMRKILLAWNGPFRLPLSGGRDSRHILLEMHRLGHPPDNCLTFQQPASGPSADTKAAQAVCSRLGVSHHVLDQERSRYTDIYRALLLTQLCADEHSQMMPMHDYFLDADGAALDGISGDILTNPDDDAERFYRYAQAGDFTRIATEMIAGHCSVLSKPGCSGGAGEIYSPDLDREVVDYIAEQMQRYADFPDPYQAFWFYNRTRREISFVSSGVLEHAEAVFCPYMDSDFVDFCLSLPFAVTRDQQLHNDAIRLRYPEVSDVPFDESFSDEPVTGIGVGRKIRNAAGLPPILKSLKPQHPMAEFKGLLLGSRGINKPHCEVYRLHHLTLQRMDAAKARRLIKLSRRLEKNRPKAPVS